MARFDLTDFEGAVIHPLLPQKSRGVAWVDDQHTTGLHTTCVNQFNRWRRAGIGSMPLEDLSKACQDDVQRIDSSSIRVHQHAGNGKKTDMIPLHGSFTWWPDD